MSRRQLLAAGHTADADIRRMLRRRELAKVHHGVYVDHTGPLTWVQRAWAAVLAVWPAALAAESVVTPGGSVVCVAVDRRRHVAAPRGVRIVHVTDLESKVLWNLGPPRMRIEEAVLDVAVAAPDELNAIAALADAVQRRQTTGARLLAALGRRRRTPRRAFLASVLADVRDGTCSVLEHGYLVRVERAHALPRGQRQQGDGLYRDVTYPEHDTYVELDGRLFHDNATARDADLERDLDAAVDGRETLRLGWGQVFGRSCVTAHKVGVVLRARGWTGTFRRCPDCPA